MPTGSIHKTPLPAGFALLAVCFGLTACDTSSEAVPATLRSDGRTIGLLLSGFDHLIYGTDDGKEECPEGLTPSSKENWYAQFPTKAARKAHFDRCGAIDNRGPDCENVLISPELARDPLPFREVEGTKSYGENLDGSEDGTATATTCAHQNFIHPDGTKGVDNQYYRLIGCQRITRLGGGYAPSSSENVSRQTVSAVRHFRVLVEIQDVDDEWNDDQVGVSIYQGRDPLAVDAEGEAVPWQSQRINRDIPAQHLRGRIANGQLITEPTDLILPEGYLFTEWGRILVRGARFSVRLTEAGAEGVRAGYIDAASLWRSRRLLEVGGINTGDSPPSFYDALHRLADGYKDPATGVCTALSSAMKLEFVRAYIQHPAAEG